MKNSVNPSVNVVRVGIVLPEDNLSSINIYLNYEDQFNISPNAALSENKELLFRILIGFSYTTMKKSV